MKPLDIRASHSHGHALPWQPPLHSQQNQLESVDNITTNHTTEISPSNVQTAAFQRRSRRVKLVCSEVDVLISEEFLRNFWVFWKDRVRLLSASRGTSLTQSHIVNPADLFSEIKHEIWIANFLVSSKWELVKTSLGMYMDVTILQMCHQLQGHLGLVKKWSPEFIQLLPSTVFKGVFVLVEVQTKSSTPWRSAMNAVICPFP
jgi:hypothetical protein